VTLREGGIVLRPLRRRDRRAWQDVRQRNREWLQPWDATLPPGGGDEIPPTFGAMVALQWAEGRAGRGLPWALEVDGRLGGQVVVGGITYGSLRSAYIGYWIDRELAGRGIIPTAVAMASDYCLDTLRLHRLEINIRPENTASLRVAGKLGWALEGIRPRYLHIAGEWRDHCTYVLFAGDQPEGVLARLRARH
jgi:ribosomal-protein-alanine N-acetyltransferase